MTKKKGRGRPKGTGRKISGKGCRTKGHDFERWCAEQFRKVFPNAKRHLEYQLEDCQGIDLDETGEYKIQCKRGKRYAPLTAIKEIQLCPIEGGIPVLVTQGNYTEPLACLPLKDFLRILASHEAKRKA